MSEKPNHQPANQHQSQNAPSNSFSKDVRPSNRNPNFVRDYFSSSRLHFIGSFRARYEAMMVSVAQSLKVAPASLITPVPLTKSSERVIAHVDMDCFFASAAVKKNPRLRGKCIAVCHGGGEISSCSYEARKYGVRAGMFAKNARKLCPQLLSIPYDFSMYESISIQMYEIFYDYPGVQVEAVSVDEAYLDITHIVEKASSQSQAGTFVQNLRSRIAVQTGCTASAGIGPSKLVARLATKAAKPNGQLRVRPENIIQYIDTLQVRDLPGVGWRMSKRMVDLGIHTMPGLRKKSKSYLQTEFGERQGHTFYDLARAIDNRPVVPLKPRKSIGAEASWGIRFERNEYKKVLKFVTDMAREVASRVTGAGASGSKMAIKLYRKKPNADMQGYKFLGHGPCTIFSRSYNLPRHCEFSTLRDALVNACFKVLSQTGMRYDEFRGIGLQVLDLKFGDLRFDHTRVAISGVKRIDSYFSSSNRKAPAKQKTSPSAGKEETFGTNHLSERPKAEGSNATLVQTTTNRRHDINVVTAGLKKSLELSSPFEQKHSSSKLDLEQHIGDGKRSSHSTEKVKLNLESTQCGEESILREQDQALEIVPAQEMHPAQILNLEKNLNPLVRGDSFLDMNPELEVNPTNDVDLPYDINLAQEVNVTQIANADIETVAGNALNTENIIEIKGFDEDTEDDCPEDIPSGWDRDVFKSLPNSLKSELLREKGNQCTAQNREKERAQNNETDKETKSKKRASFHGREPKPTKLAKRPRRKHGAQVTMTQFAIIRELREKGNDVLDAEEFKGKPLGECVELLHDLNHGRRVGGLKNKRVKPNGPRSRERKRISFQEPDKVGVLSQDGLDIPSPPCMSSDSEESDVILGMVEREASRFEQVYADEGVEEFSEKLYKWMCVAADDVKTGHVELVRGLLMQLIRLKQLERLCETMRLMRTFGEKSKLRTWRGRINELMKEVDEETCRQHGLNLKLPDLFPDVEHIGLQRGGMITRY